jgi:molybdopterin converting factor small subunit
MKVTLKYMGQLKYLTGRDSDQIDCSQGVSLAELMTAASKKYDQRFINIVLDENGSIRPSLVVVINGATAVKDAAPNLSDGDSITLLTAIAGG